MTLKDFLVRMIPTNIVGDIAKGDIMPVLIMAVLFGFALCQIGERRQRITQLLDDLTHAVASGNEFAPQRVPVVGVVRCRPP